LRDVLDGLKGRVRLVGCPAEERGNGKVQLIDEGAFEGVDAALMYHPGDRDEIDPLMLAMVNLDVELLGKAAHAAAEPHEGVNARPLGRTLHPRRPSDTHGSTDMGNVTTLVPGIHPFLSITEGPVPGHSVAFTEAAKAPRALATMRLAAKALAMTALDAFADG